jgi:hypothetical protein
VCFEGDGAIGCVWGTGNSAAWCGALCGLERVHVAELSLRRARKQDVLCCHRQETRVLCMVRFAVALRFSLAHCRGGRAERTLAQRVLADRRAGTVCGVQRGFRRKGVPLDQGWDARLLLHARGAHRDLPRARRECAHLRRAEPAEVRAQRQRGREWRQASIHLPALLVARHDRHGRGRDRQLRRVRVRPGDGRRAARRRLGHLQLSARALRAQGAPLCTQPAGRWPSSVLS